MTNEIVAAANVAEKADAVRQKMEALQAYVMHHVLDSHVLVLPFGLSVQLPEFISVHGIMMLLACLTILLIIVLARRSRGDVPTGMLNLLEMLVVFIRDYISVPFLGKEDGRKFAPLFCSFFSFIAVMDLIGLVPCFYTATSNIGVTAALAAVTFFFMIFGAMYRIGFVSFLKSFVPRGIPWPILILLVPMEVFSVLIRTGALAIRLFANMLAGHLVLFFMVGLVFLFGFVALPVTLLALFVYLLEVFIALFQAYIFTLLSAIFIGERYHPQH